MAVPNLPRTQIKLATSSSFYVLKESSISLRTSFASIFSPRSETSAIRNQMQPVSALLSFTEDQQREAQHRYEVDSNVRGEPLAVLASPVRRTFRIKRAVLYATSLMDILGYGRDLAVIAGVYDAGILSQSISDPFIFIKRDSSPDNAHNLITFYRGCILSNLTRTLDVSQAGGSVGVFEEASVSYAGRQQFAA